MKYFLDAEFIEDGRTIDLISIGIVAEDGRELYLGNRDCDFGNASEWVIENVLWPMGFERMPKCSWKEGHMKPIDPAFWVSCDEIASQVCEFFGVKRLDNSGKVLIADDFTEPEIWGEWCSYDWVAFCQLFGTMMDLPSSFPMRCRDVVQFCEDSLGLSTDLWPKSLETEGNHNALMGAKTVRERWVWCNAEREKMISFVRWEDDTAKKYYVPRP